MFKLETRRMKAQCWGSRWRGIGDNGEGRPTHFIPLTQDEMLRAAATGHVDVPEAIIPQVVRDRQEYMDLMAADMGFGFEKLPESTQRIIAQAALEAVPA